MIANYCRPCGENLTPEQTECPFCGQKAVPIDELPCPRCKGWGIMDPSGQSYQVFPCPSCGVGSDEHPAIAQSKTSSRESGHDPLD